ncbi:MAG: glycosyl transferase group 1 [Deltaproteobacteria bacterium]|nr:glycosyl transferase group 1 [Deltaproteobacteria bacterium]
MDRILRHGNPRVESMKVLLINNGKGWSGGQEHLKDLALELRGRGVEIHFTARAGTLSESRFRDCGFPVHPVPYRHGIEDIKSLIGLVALLRRERFDIVSINREHDLLRTALAWRLAFPLRRPGRLMMSYHLPTDHLQPLLGTADAVVCISEHVKGSLLRRNPSAAARTHILYYGISLSGPPPASRYAVDRPRRFFRGAGFPLIGMVGEFWKNQMELVEMTPLLKAVFPTLTVALIGNASDRSLVAPLEERIRQLELGESVVFTGLVPRERIPDVFHDLDLSVTTHRNEGFGIVHLESLAAGTPVVAYNEGGFVDIFKGEDVGVLVDGGPADFAAATIALLSDDARRFAMGAMGYELVARRYSLRAMGDAYLDFYRKLGSA